MTKIHGRDLTLLDHKLIKAYKAYLRVWSRKALEKFVKGRLEHWNEPFEEQDFEAEIENEIFDVTAYNFGRILTNKNK